MLRINFVTYKECLYKECHGTGEKGGGGAKLSDGVKKKRGHQWIIQYSLVGSLELFMVQKPMNVQFYGDFWDNLLRVLRLEVSVYNFPLQTSFKPLLLTGGGGGGVKSICRGDCE